MQNRFAKNTFWELMQIGACAASSNRLERHGESWAAGESWTQLATARKILPGASREARKRQRCCLHRRDRQCTGGRGVSSCGSITDELKPWFSPLEGDLAPPYPPQALKLRRILSERSRGLQGVIMGILPIWAWISLVHSWGRVIEEAFWTRCLYLQRDDVGDHKLIHPEHELDLNQSDLNHRF